LREVDTEAVRQKAIDIVGLGAGMRTDEFFGALVIASAQSLKGMCSPVSLRPTVEWFINEVARMAMLPEDEERTH
jgi:hypothetical protein